MRYYSDSLNKYFDTAKECLDAEKAETDRIAKAEKEAAKKANERKKDADAVKAAREALIEAQKAYQKTLTDFCKKYPEGYHQTFSAKDADDLQAIIDFLFN